MKNRFPNVLLGAAFCALVLIGCGARPSEPKLQPGDTNPDPIQAEIEREMKAKGKTGGETSAGEVFKTSDNELK